MSDDNNETNPHPGKKEGAPRIIWWLKGEPRQNFGNYLTDFLWKSLGGDIRVRGDAYRLIGSTICDGIILGDLQALGKWDNGRVVFWCCGTRDETPPQPEFLERSVFCGVRGPLSRDALKLPASTVLGDPALVLPLLYKPKPSERTNGKTVCVPHFHDRKSDEDLLARTKADVIVRPAIANSPEALTGILDEIASAEFVLAGSLHAAIVAAAYDVPFCYMDDGHLDVPFKWRDFSASMDIGTFLVDRVAEGRRLYDECIRPRLRKPLLFPILAAAPFRVRREHLMAAALHDVQGSSKSGAIDVEAFSKYLDLVEAVDSATSVKLAELETKYETLTESHSSTLQALSEARQKYEKQGEELSNALLTCERLLSELEQKEHLTQLFERLAWLTDPAAAGHFLAREVWFERQRWGLPYKFSKAVRSLATSIGVAAIVERELGKLLCTLGYTDYGTELWNRAESRRR